MKTGKKIKISAVLFWLLNWQIAALIWKDSIVFVGPVDMMRALIDQAGSSSFWISIARSFLCIMGGFLAAFAAAALLAVLTAVFPVLGAKVCANGIFGCFISDFGWFEVSVGGSRIFHGVSDFVHEYWGRDYTRGPGYASDGRGLPDASSQQVSVYLPSGGLAVSSGRRENCGRDELESRSGGRNHRGTVLYDRRASVSVKNLPEYRQLVRMDTGYYCTERIY